MCYLYYTFLKRSAALFYSFSVNRGGAGDEVSLRFILFLLSGLFGVFQ